MLSSRFVLISLFLKSVFTFPQSVNNKQVIVGARTVWKQKIRNIAVWLRRCDVNSSATALLSMTSFGGLFCINYNDAKFTSWFTVSVTDPMVYQAAFAQRLGVACRNLQSFWFIDFDENFYWSQHWFTWPLPRRKCDYLWVITDIKTRATCMPDSFRNQTDKQCGV